MLRDACTHSHLILCLRHNRCPCGTLEELEPKKWRDGNGMFIDLGIQHGRRGHKECVERIQLRILALWLLGIGAGLYSVNCPPYLMHVNTAETRHHAFAAQGAVLAFMAFAGSL